MVDERERGARGPLVLGADGRVGRLWRRLAARGLWPGPEPWWHARRPGPGLEGWNLDDEPPPGTDLSGAQGMIVLAGATGGDAAALGANTTAALGALALARAHGLGPVLLLSSAAVYGRAEGPSAEDGPVRPATPYGEAKLAMETAAREDAARRGGPLACCLRLGNAAGADMLFGAAAAGSVTLDRFADGAAPRRAYVGPLTLARAALALLALGPRLPPVLNVAQPGLVAMDAVLAAAGVPWAWREAPPMALPALEMDLSRLESLAPVPPALPESLVAEARAGGWEAAA